MMSETQETSEPLETASQLATATGALETADCPPFSVVIPAYNEEDGAVVSLQKLQEDLRHVETPYEIIVVNDGSTDGTLGKLQSFDGIVLLNHKRNRGYGAALKTGIRRAKYPWIVITDADGSYPNDRIPDLLRLTRDADMVVGARTGKNVEYSPVRGFAKWFLKRFAEWMAHQEIPDINSGLRVFRKSVAEKFLHLLPDTFSFTTTITLAMLTNRYQVHFEPIDYQRRLGKSKIKPIRDTLRFIQLILRTGMYFAPLRVFLPVAGVFFAGFLGTLSWDVYRGDLTERTLILFVAATQFGMFALLADMIDKRSNR